MTIRAHKEARIAGAKLAEGAGAPSEAHLAQINKLALRALNADEVYVRTVYLAHNAIDRDREAFDDTLINDFANTLPGKGLFVRHPGGWDGDSGPGVGRWIDARVVDMPLDEARTVLREPKLAWPPGTERAKLLESTFYLLRTSDTKDLIDKIDGGIAADVSIGFRAADRSGISDAAQNTIAYRLLGPGEALEGSLVWLGAQPGARVHKSATREDETMTPEEIKALQAKLAAAEKAAADNKAKAEAHDALMKELGDAKSVAALKAAAADGAAYRAQIVDDIVKAERIAGMIKGDDEKAVNEAKAQYADWPLSRLKAWAEKLGKTETKGGHLQGGDPNAGQGEPTTLAKDSPLANPLISGKAA